VLKIGTKKKSSLAMHTDKIARFPVHKTELDRFKFGRRRYRELCSLQNGGTLKCLDVACGAKPFPDANILCDLNVSPVPDRRMKTLVTEGKPFVLCDSRYLPFKDKAFDFATSYYLIEHMDDPASLFKELKRVSEHGYIQCPSWFSELLYKEDVHRWIVFKRNGQLFVKSLNYRKRSSINLGFVFHKLYRLTEWQIMHAILDETFHLFTVTYSY
jgi:SAM-dependent methyltransferase